VKKTKQKPSPKPVSSALAIFRSSLSHLMGHSKLYLGIVAVYLLLTIVMVKGLGVSIGTSEIKSSLTDVFTGSGGTLLAGLTVFGVLLSSSSSASSDVASLYQTILVVLTSLAVIWALRQSYAGVDTSVKESFYKGMYPIIPFVLVLLVVGLQLMPLVIGSWLYSAVISGGLAISAAEQTIWAVLVIGLSILTVYWLSSSVFALYIVTLPDMTPLKALRSARQLVRRRRFLVMRKVLFLPVVLLLLGALVMVPLIIFITPVAEWVYFGLSMAVLAIIHSYIYNLYRELL
jgi:hypothetical protein